jgi:alpha-L-fucosidase 2
MPVLPSECLTRRLEWPFPSTDCHSGVPIANGTLGALLWAQGNVIRITINRADYWDRRCGLTFGPEATYANLRAWLKEGDEASLRRAFEGRSPETGELPTRSTRLPMGRLDIALPEPARIKRGGLWLLAGRAELDWDGGYLQAVVSLDRNVLSVHLDGIRAEALDLRGEPPVAPAVVGRFRQVGMPEPEFWGDSFAGGWVQTHPEEPTLAVAWETPPTRSGVDLFATAQYGSDSDAARTAAVEALAEAVERGYSLLAEESAAGWETYWSACPKVLLPDPALELLYHLGMYKLRCIAAPDGPAATLQGPWVEEHCLPPWSSDYHFNVNVQECYWPAYAGNQIELLEPLFRMLRGWEPRLRATARQFVGVSGERTEDGIQLPHAADDRGTPMAGFWSGAVDHGCTAWVAQLMWQRHRFAPDAEFLRETVTPWLKGALAVYERMLEEDGDGLSLPVSVSPEYGGSGMGAWGRNASFQLAAIHFLLNALEQAAAELGDAPDPRWTELRRRVPIAAVGEGPEILLWEGQPLAESHRHHSHLAGIYPFETLRPGEPEQDELIRHSLRRWTRVGMGQWTGWCLPWAAIIHARTGNGDMAALLLDIFRRAFMRAGFASTHDAYFPGFTVMDRRPEIMQVEAACGAAAAVLEMLLQTVDGVTRVFPAIPSSWQEARFDGIRAAGGFLLSAALADGRVGEVRVRSDQGGHLRLRNPFAAPAEGEVLELDIAAGEELTLVASLARQEPPGAAEEPLPP